MTSDPAKIDLTTNLVSPGYTSYDSLTAITNTVGLTDKGWESLRRQLQSINLTLPPNRRINIPTARPSKDALQELFGRLELYTSAGGSYQTATGTQPFVFSIQNLSSQFPGPAKFYTKGNLSTDRWVLPVPPADFSVTVPNSQNSITTINGFSYTHAGPIDLDEISFESFFPALSGNEQKPDFLPDYFGAYRFETPKSWVANLVTAMRANQPLLFAVYTADGAGSVITTDSGVIVEPVAMSIASFDWSMGTSVGGTRRDVSYSITLKRWRRQAITISNFVKQKNNSGGSSQAPSAGSGSSGGSAGVYTVRAKDTLFKIAAKTKVLDDGRRWKEIYNLNKAKISKDYTKYSLSVSSGSRIARVHGYPITPGTVLKIPKK